MKPPFATIPLAGQLVRIVDANHESVTVMPARPASQLVALVNTIPSLTDALEETAVVLWNASDAQLAEMACALEGIARCVDPAFALVATPVASICADSESSLSPDPRSEDLGTRAEDRGYAQALMELNSAPAACVASEEGGSGSLLR